ncbi:MAG: DUF924 domain-containing protein [Acidimicrobiales bacterium]|nr:DUF924 domain-containing protein [Hyphomonadaceae bacterium]RZV40887.1 MAG: DUF924 domain-containing protein [Acidimicrobiales bacterium]
MSIEPDSILDFWFEEAGPKKWYNGGDAFDAEIRSRFESFTIETAAKLRRDGQHKWEDDPNSGLALIIALDQFPRNMFRATKAAFAFDDLALLLAQRAVDRGYDLKIGQDRRAFFYMPYMHSENLKIQDECIRLIDMRLDNANNLHHAREHRKLIAKFNRFPHRNAILGRQSTPEEQRFLNAGGYSP